MIIDLLKKQKIAISFFIVFAVIILLIPPFSWGNELTKTVDERFDIAYYYKNKIPFKEHDFLFNNIKKNFAVSGKNIYLERHLLQSELIIELFIALLLSFILQMLINITKQQLHKG